MGPLSELRLGRKVRRCRLVIAWGGPENVRNGRGISAVIASQRQNAIRDGYAYGNPLSLALAIRNLAQRLLKCGVEKSFEGGIECDQHLVRRSGGGFLRSSW